MNNQERFNRVMEAGENGKFFTVTFIKRSTGEKRTMNARLGVKKHLRGGTLSYNPSEHNLIPVYDVKSGGYRSIPVEGLIEINGQSVV